MSLDAITVAVGSLSVATVSLAVSAANAWLTLWRRGTVRMAQPPTVYFGPDGARELHPKVFVRCFLYSTSVRSRCIEGMFARLRRGDSSQTFPVWVCGGMGRGLPDRSTSGCPPAGGARAMTYREGPGSPSEPRESPSITTSCCRAMARPTSSYQARMSSSFSLSSSHRKAL